MEGEWSSETSRSVVVHFMLDQRKPLGFLTLINALQLKGSTQEMKQSYGYYARGATRCNKDRWNLWRVLEGSRENFSNLSAARGAS
jgi:hypothetical protein